MDSRTFAFADVFVCDMTRAGSCYVEFGQDRVGRVDVDFFSGPVPKGRHIDASEALVHEKQLFGSSRKTRWFGL